MGLRSRLKNLVKRSLRYNQNAEPDTRRSVKSSESQATSQVVKPQQKPKEFITEASTKKVDLTSSEDLSPPKEVFHSSSAEKTEQTVNDTVKVPTVGTQPRTDTQPKTDKESVLTTVQEASENEQVYASDYLTDDAPNRNAHYRQEYSSTEKSLMVKVHNPETGQLLEFKCEPEEFILEAADRAGLELPYSCRSGGCLACSAKTIRGEFEMAEQYVLEDEDIEQGFVLLCCTTPTSDAEFISHQEENIGL